MRDSKLIAVALPMLLVSILATRCNREKTAPQNPQAPAPTPEQSVDLRQEYDQYESFLKEVAKSNDNLRDLVDSGHQKGQLTSEETKKLESDLQDCDDYVAASRSAVKSKDPPTERETMVSLSAGLLGAYWTLGEDVSSVKDTGFRKDLLDKLPFDPKKANLFFESPYMIAPCRKAGRCLKCPDQCLYCNANKSCPSR